MFLKRYHRGLDVLHEGTEKKRSYFIPYSSMTTARTNKREESEQFTLLNGEWKFKWFAADYLVQKDDVGTAVDVSSYDDIEVPCCWQIYTERKNDVPLYSNLEYPFPTDPPHVPVDDPCGIYYKSVDIRKNGGRKYFLNFEGVSSSFYLYINGKYVGYSQVSHSTSEFDITDYITDGENKFTVVVIKWCDGSYLEDQDFFRLSGIFRDVYILERPSDHIRDFTVKTTLNDDFSRAEIEIVCEKNMKIHAEYENFTVSGSKISVDKPRLWSAESPALYTIYLEYNGEIIPVKIGIRKCEIDGRVFKINGKRVCFHGVNRHDNDPETGYYLTYEKLERDVKLIKDANCDMVRTSHYPNDPRFVELCNEYGLYLVDEADLETHGMGYDDVDNWDWTRWSALSNSPDWTASYIDRAECLYERDKNQPSVVMWSLGNESGCGVNHRRMANFIREKDPSAIIHYENSHKEFKAIPEGECFADVSDVESRMYASVPYIEEYLKDETNTKPFFMCEYVDSMTTGDVYDYMKFEDDFEGFAGGCVWEFSDHALLDRQKNDGYLYGGDYGDEPNNSYGCVDGVVFPDRTPRPGYFDVKKCYEPFKMSLENGNLSVFNRRSFVDLSDLYLDCTVKSNGTLLKEFTLDLSVEPKCTEVFEDILHGEDYSSQPNCFFTAEARRKSDDFSVGFYQKELGKTFSNDIGVGKYENACFTEGDMFYRVSYDYNELTYKINKNTGLVDSISAGGREILDDNIKFDISRAKNYHSGSFSLWEKRNFDKVKMNVYDVRPVPGDEIRLAVDYSLGSFMTPPFVRGTLYYTFLPTGELLLDTDGTVLEKCPLLPHLGFKIVLDKSFDRVKYFGLCDRESYPDRYKSCRFDMCETTTEKMFTHYIKPQENGNRFLTRFGEISDGQIKIAFASTRQNTSFSFKALPYSSDDEMNAAHDTELPEIKNTYLNLDYKVNSISEDENLDVPKNSRNFGDKEFSFGFRIKITRGDKNEN